MNAETSREKFANFVPVTVRWGEMDSLGHVNNTVFYRYSEDGRIDYLRRIIESEVSDKMSGFILADLRCTFLQQLRYPAQVEIATRVLRIGRSSLRVVQGLYPQGGEDVIAAYDSMLVWFDYVAQTSTAVPEVVRQRIRSIETVLPQE